MPPVSPDVWFVPSSGRTGKCSEHILPLQVPHGHSPARKGETATCAAGAPRGPCQAQQDVLCCPLLPGALKIAKLHSGLWRRNGGCGQGSRILLSPPLGLWVNFCLLGPEAALPGLGASLNLSQTQFFQSLRLIFLAQRPREDWIIAPSSSLLL